MNVLTKPMPFPVRDAISSLEILDIRTRETAVVRGFDRCVEAPNWTRDGRRLIVNDAGRLVSVDIASGELASLDTGFCVHCNNDHVLSPTDGRIAVSHHTAEDMASRIYVVDPSGGAAPLLVTPIAPSYLHGWSPDGSTLCYCAERNGEYDVYTVPAQGGVETRLTFAPGLSDGPEYSPDGAHIWFNSVRSGLMQIWRMDNGGGNQTQMTRDPQRNCWFPHVSPDGKLVAFIAYREGDVAPGDHPPNRRVELMLMPADGGACEPLLSLFGGQGTLNVNSWSPDSTRIAFVRYAERSQSGY